jgi:hypothetical protein
VAIPQSYPTTFKTLSEIVLRLKEILNRFLNALRCIDIASLSDNRLEDWHKPWTYAKRHWYGMIEI